ncbi:MAG: hypothetical protein M0R76_13410, partial [Proteobacteria bacterium]|nr:hypothetical protein [Pseudomonadota bacterium]
QSCISVSGVDRAGQHFELLCIGAGVSVGSSVVRDFDNPDTDTWITRLGGSCRTLRVTEPVKFDAYVLAWDSVPAIFDETVQSGDGMAIPLYISHRFNLLDGPPYSSTATGNIDIARMHGWVRHAVSEPGKPTVELMEGVFSAKWDDVDLAYALRLRGTIKAYLKR